MVTDRVGRAGQWAQLGAWSTMVGVECGLAGPFGSYPASPWNRLFFWVGLCWAGTALLAPGTRLARRLATRYGVPLPYAVGAMTLATSVPLAGCAALLCFLVWPVHAKGTPLLEWLGLTLIGAAPAAALLAWADARDAKLHTGAAADPPTSPELVGAEPPTAAEPLIASEPLPLALVANALCLQMEDHHVRVHLATHSRLHLRTLREAIADMGEARGRQVHRSWWVARAAVAGWQEDGRTVTLLLVNDLRVPVARQRVAVLRAEGWFS